MYYSSSGDIVSWIYLIFFIIIVVSCCASGDSNSSGGNSSKTTTKRSTSRKRSSTNMHSYRSSYCECPSCGAPYYDGYCEECGYPDVNQGWLGEEYG